MSNAKSTIESSILDGLTGNVKVAIAIRPDDIAELAIKDVIDAMFHSSVRWSVIQYAKELELCTKEM